MQGEGLTNEGRHICCYCVSKLVTRGIAESLHAQITRARLSVCVRWAYFGEKYHPEITVLVFMRC